MPEECSDVLDDERAKQLEVMRGHLSPCKLGYMERKEVKDIVLVTGATRALVRDNLVPRIKYLNKFVSVQCMHGDYVSYPLAKVEVMIDGRSYFVEAAVIGELFTRMVMFVVGPLPRSSSGHKYILVCEYATRYPEAIPMKAVDAKHVAEELVTMLVCQVRSH